MHSLFWKFFISFWAALVLFVVATVWTTSHFLERTRAQIEEQSPRQQMRELVSEGQAAADRGGVEGLKTWLRQIDRQRAVPLLLLDTNGTDLLERPVSARIESHNRRRMQFPAQSAGAVSPRFRPMIHVHDGSSYRLHARPPGADAWARIAPSAGHVDAAVAGGRDQRAGVFLSCALFVRTHPPPQPCHKATRPR